MIADKQIMVASLAITKSPTIIGTTTGDFILERRRCELSWLRRARVGDLEKVLHKHTISATTKVLYSIHITEEDLVIDHRDDSGQVDSIGNSGHR
jgi:hypothetical protein